MKKVIVAACLLTSALATPVLAANANRPYQNCDRKIDNCGPTGNETTDQLNAQQLSGGGQPAPMPGSSGASMPMSPPARR